MPTSGTTDFTLTLGNLALLAFGRIGIRRAAITQDHLQDFLLEANLMQAEWSADGINWWTVDQVTTPLVAGTATYSVPENVISVLDVIINNNSTNRLIMPFSRTDYASLGDPTSQGFPTSYWYDRALEPTIVLWPVPDSSTTYSMSYYVYTMTEDATFGNETTPAVPYWWLDAYVAGMSHRLSRHWAPALEQIRGADALRSYQTACKQVEPAPIYVTPGLSGYYR